MKQRNNSLCHNILDFLIVDSILTKSNCKMDSLEKNQNLKTVKLCTTYVGRNPDLRTLIFFDFWNVTFM